MKKEVATLMGSNLECSELDNSFGEPGFNEWCCWTNFGHQQRYEKNVVAQMVVVVAEPLQQ